MKRNLRNVGTWSAVVLLPVVLITAPRAAQSIPVRDAGNNTDARVLAMCADSVVDQSGSGCLQASSVPVSGLLFPPPHDGGVGNDADGLYSFVGGGGLNRASGYLSTIGGGGGAICYGGNYASGTSSTIGGGSGNIAFGSGSTVAGGGSYLGGNEASGDYSSVGGGDANTAVGRSSTIPGGKNNRASGTFSFAAGRKAKANHEGSFVWGDSQNTNKPSSAPNEFNIYASGGTRVFSNSAATTGVLLAAGAGSWTSVSDRNAKENVLPVDGRDVLERLADIPIATWNYKAQDDEIRHMGPMAQDFYAAFGLGLGDKTIDTIDPDGVALAAIQGLNERDAEFAALLAQKKTEIAVQGAEIARLRADLEELRGALGALTSK